jgi:hypothetical protein
MYRVRIIAPHFCIGSTHYPEGSEITVNAVVRDYLVKEKRGEDITDKSVSPSPVAVAQSRYNRRDMQAEEPGRSPVAPAPISAPPPSSPEATEEGVEEKPKRRGRPPGSKTRKKVSVE